MEVRKGFQSREKPKAKAQRCEGKREGDESSVATGLMRAADRVWLQGAWVTE